MSEVRYLHTVWNYYLARLHDARDESGAISTETAIITAILAGLAITVGAIIVTKVTTKAESIPTD